MLLVIPCKGFRVFVCLSQVCIPDLNLVCIVKFKQEYLRPSENVLFGTITSKRSQMLTLEKVVILNPNDSGFE